MILIVRRLIVLNKVYGGFHMLNESKIKKDFGMRLRKIRKERALSQEQLALACELDRTYIGGIERGERNISLVNIVKIANALGLKTKDLF